LATLTKESSVSIKEREQDQVRPAPRTGTGNEGGESRRRSPIQRLRDLWEGVSSEIKKVTWPTRTETRNLTIVVIGISVFVGGVLGIVDLVLVQLVKMLTGGGF
jgi:preprotein translocase subunit SecE